MCNSSNLSIVIPYRDNGQPDRKRIAEWFFVRLKYLYPNAEIILSDAGDRVFSRGASINRGVEKSTRDYIIITDSDYLISDKLAKDLINNKPWTVCVDHKNYYFLNELVTSRILRLDPCKFDVKSFDYNNNIQQSTYFLYGGILAMPKKNFVKFDETCSGYGFEDNVFWQSMTALYGKEHRTSNCLYHLFHQRIANSMYMKYSYVNKDYFDRVWKPLLNDKKAIIELMKKKNLI
jgi:predicted glycosyltransferase involved in capsule biosynthesis